MSYTFDIKLEFERFAEANCCELSSVACGGQLITNRAGVVAGRSGVAFSDAWKIRQIISENVTQFVGCRVLGQLSILPVFSKSNSSLSAFFVLWLAKHPCGN